MFGVQQLYRSMSRSVEDTTAFSHRLFDQKLCWQEEEEVIVWSVALAQRSSRAWLRTQYEPFGHWMTVRGGVTEFIKKPIESGMLGDGRGIKDSC